MKEHIGIGKIATICLVLVLCLAAIGVGYGHWTETLNIQGTVGTGEMSVGFLNAVASDNEDALGLDNVGLTNVTLCDMDGDGVNELMQVDLSEGYFCYEGTVTFDVKNHGTVPAKVTAIDITEPAGGELEVAVDGIAVGSVIDGGASLACELTAHIAANGTGSGGFTVNIEFVNWNEGG